MIEQSAGRSECSTSAIGTLFVYNLNRIYRSYEGYSKVTGYDWCGCGGLSAGAIAGIVIATIAFVVILILMIYFCVMSRRAVAENN